jgi:hypothetical protein
MNVERVKNGQEVADIISTIVVLNRGNFVIECGRELQELTDAIVDTGKKGALVIKLEVTPSGLKEGRVNQFEIRPDVSINKPKHDQGKSIFFVTQDNKLVREDPNQMQMEYERETNGRR